MRAFLAATVLWLGLSAVAPEPEYPSLFGLFLQMPGGRSNASPVEIESSGFRGNRLTVATAQASDSVHESEPARGHALPIPAPVGEDPLAVDGSEPRQTQQASLDDLCDALYTSAQDNKLPVPFFANLIWQESRLRENEVSPKGALGIAQFMPQTAAESGLDDPFDPRQAIPASARLLRALRDQFGNLGLAAAAYNAGARRVSEWIERGRTLPRETLDYVLRVTGRSAEQWRTTPPSDDAVIFVRHLPCRTLPAFADLEQAQAQQAQAEQAARAEGQPASDDRAKALEASAKAYRDARWRHTHPSHLLAKSSNNKIRVAENAAPAARRRGQTRDASEDKSKEEKSKHRHERESGRNLASHRVTHRA